MGEGGPEMTSSMSHPASAVAGESQGGVYGAALCSRRGSIPEMALIHRQGVAPPPWAQAGRSGRRRRFAELGGRRAAGSRQALPCTPELELKLSVSAGTAGATTALQM